MKDLEAIDETRQETRDNASAYYKRVIKAYNKVIKVHHIQPGDLTPKMTNFVRKNISPSSKFYPHWEGHFIVKEVHSSGYY